MSQIPVNLRDNNWDLLYDIGYGQSCFLIYAGIRGMSASRQKTKKSLFFEKKTKKSRGLLSNITISIRGVP
jgi:hypothetical protein